MSVVFELEGGVLRDVDTNTIGIAFGSGLAGIEELEFVSIVGDVVNGLSIELVVKLALLVEGNHSANEIAHVVGSLQGRSLEMIVAVRENDANADVFVGIAWCHGVLLVDEPNSALLGGAASSNRLLLVGGCWLLRL
jgi:hypothetical protein